MHRDKLLAAKSGFKQSFFFIIANRLFYSPNSTFIFLVSIDTFEELLLPCCCSLVLDRQLARREGSAQLMHYLLPCYKVLIAIKMVAANK